MIADQGQKLVQETSLEAAFGHLLADLARGAKTILTAPKKPPSKGRKTDGQA